MKSKISDTYETDERIAIKLSCAKDVYPDPIRDYELARQDAESEVVESGRRLMKSAGYEQQTLL